MNKELLTIVMEECGELIQVCSKLQRFSSKEFGDFDEVMAAGLKEEAGDVYCMIKLLIEHGYITQQDLDDREVIKRERLRKWSHVNVDLTQEKE